MTALATPVYLFAAPIVAALVIALLARAPRWLAVAIALVGPALTLLAGIACLLPADKPASSAVTSSAFTLGRVVAAGSVRWFSAAGATARLGWTVDGLAAAMLVAVGLVAACVVVFSAGYMSGDSGWNRYFALLSLFGGSMNLVVIASSFPALFVGWELVGACSYLLIGFWYKKPAAAAAAVKAFLTTRVGDVGLLLGISVLWAATGHASYEGALGNLGTVPVGVATAAAVAVAIGAIGKSAQFPLHAWLPDAMEGPTPVSALIHAATMVAAGVYLVVRVWPLFDAAPVARVVLLGAGLVSAIGAALVALVQRDIKKVLAYSTVSQLGFMFVALGVGAWFAAFFHLLAHAAFKALLFLASGSVIHGSGTQDMHEMGGLRREMPITFAVWTVGVLSLAGIPPLAGFFSKDLLLEKAWAFSPAIGVALLGASMLTAFYAARSTRLVFFGRRAAEGRAHESGAVMSGPIVLLAATVFVVGWLGAGLAHRTGAEAEPLNFVLSAVAVLAALVGAAGGWSASAGVPGDEKTARALGGFAPLLTNAFYWDRLVDAVVVRPCVAGARALWAIGDRLIADGAAEGSGRVARKVGRLLSGLQGGDTQSYATIVALGFVLMMVATIWLGR